MRKFHTGIDSDGAIVGGIIALGSVSGAQSADTRLGDTITLTLTGNVTLTLNNGANRQRIVVEPTQNGTGGYTLTIVDSVFGTDITSLTITTAASKSDMIGLIRIGSVWRVVSHVKGF